MTEVRVLIVDDEKELRDNVVSILSHQISEFKLHFQEAENGLKALEYLSHQKFDLVLMDVKMPELSGLEALVKIKEKDPSTFVVIMTAHANTQDAVVAIKEGAYDYVEKPIQAQALTAMIRKALEAQAMISSLALSRPIFDDDVDSEFVGQSSKMREIFSLIAKLCKVDTTVMIRGENGTGKELVARAIHYSSTKKTGPFIAINCGAIPENLMESELFGHEKGSFTGATDRKIGKFQQANLGTLFLDEIGELKPDLQVKLLRVLQEKKFTPLGSTREMKSGARVIAATNRNLEKMISEGTFREDLFYRLNVMPLFLPPLRERKEDIPHLVQHFIKKFLPQHPESKIQSLHPQALEALKAHSWPGNIRELENAIERSFIVEPSAQITLSSLPEVIRRGASTPSPLTQAPESKNTFQPLDYEVYKEGAEKEFIISALRANKGKINQTVAQANIPKNTLLRKIKKYGINPEDYKN